MTGMEKKEMRTERLMGSKIGKGRTKTHFLNSQRVRGVICSRQDQAKFIEIL